MSETTNATRKCPHCAEEILAEAKKCKHCGSELLETGPRRRKPGSIEKPLIWGVGAFIFICLFVAAWFLPFFVVGGWLLWKKVAPGRNRKIAMATLAVAFVIATGVHDHYTGPPSVRIVSPESGATISASTTVVSGTVSREGVPVRVNGVDADLNGKAFTATVPLPDQENTVTVLAGEIAGEAENIGRATVLIRRSFTPEEWAARKREIESERQRAADEAAATEARAKAAEDAWASSAAGKLCAAHSDWSREECAAVAGRKYWVGMTYDMLVASYGSRPNSVNPSNYGGGTRYQYCWNRMTPSCFYDDNADGVIDAYN